MSKTGIRLSSNICIAWDNYQETGLHHTGGVHKIEGIYELPAACFFESGLRRNRKYRAAQITAYSTSELKKILNQCFIQQASNFILVTHPFEYIKKR